MHYNTGDPGGESKTVHRDYSQEYYNAMQAGKLAKRKRARIGIDGSIAEQAVRAQSDRLRAQAQARGYYPNRRTFAALLANAWVAQPKPTTAPRAPARKPFQWPAGLNMLGDFTDYMKGMMALGEYNGLTGQGMIDFLKAKYAEGADIFAKIQGVAPVQPVEAIIPEQFAPALNPVEITAPPPPPAKARGPMTAAQRRAMFAKQGGSFRNRAPSGFLLNVMTGAQRRAMWAKKKGAAGSSSVSATPAAPPPPAPGSPALSSTIQAGRVNNPSGVSAQIAAKSSKLSEQIKALEAQAARQVAASRVPVHQDTGGFIPTHRGGSPTPGSAGRVSATPSRSNLETPIRLGSDVVRIPGRERGGVLGTVGDAIGTAGGSLGWDPLNPEAGLGAYHPAGEPGHAPVVDYDPYADDPNWDPTGRENQPFPKAPLPRTNSSAPSIRYDPRNPTPPQGPLPGGSRPVPGQAQPPYRPPVNQLPPVTHGPAIPENLRINLKPSRLDPGGSNPSGQGAVVPIGGYGPERAAENPRQAGEHGPLSYGEINDMEHGVVLRPYLPVSEAKIRAEYKRDHPNGYDGTGENEDEYFQRRVKEETIMRPYFYRDDPNFGRPSTTVAARREARLKAQGKSKTTAIAGSKSRFLQKYGR